LGDEDQCSDGVRWRRGRAPGLIGRVTGEFFTILRHVPVLGRPIIPEDEIEARRVVVLSHALWLRHVGGIMVRLAGF
jgi:hypothetical protein